MPGEVGVFQLISGGVLGVLNRRVCTMFLLLLVLVGSCPLRALAYDIVPLQKEVDTGDPDVVITERLPMVSGLADPEMMGTVNELIRYFYDRFYIVREEERETRSLWMDYEISVKTEVLLSLKIHATEYFLEAAHPLNYLDAITLDLEKGAVLALEDLFHPNSNYRQRINSFIRQRLSRTDASGQTVIPLISPFRGIRSENPFYLTQNGVVIFFPEYEYTPHSWGALEIEIPYDLLEDIMRHPERIPQKEQENRQLP